MSAKLPFSPDKVIETIAESVVCVDLAGIITYWSQGAERLYGYPAAEAVGLHFSILYPGGREGEFSRVGGLGETVVRSGRVAVEGWRVTKSGRRIYVRLTAMPILDDTGQHVGYIGYSTDLTERKQAEDLLAQSEIELRRQNAFAESLLTAQSQAGVGLLIVDEGRIVFANEAASVITGYNAQELLAFTSFLDLVGPADRERIGRNHQRRLAGEIFENRYDMQILRRDGSLGYVELAVALIPSGDHFSVLGIVVDITGRKLAEERIQFLALHDSLTGLANRMLCFDHLRASIAAARRRAGSFAVLYVDLDDFKPINDAHGHLAGDLALRTVASRLRAAVRESDLVARTGGDEFIIIVNDAHLPSAAVVVAEKIIASIGQPLPIPGCPQTLGISVGIALYPMHGEDVDSLILHADIAMYEAKRRGKNRCVMYGEPMLAPLETPVADLPEPNPPEGA